MERVKERALGRLLCPGHSVCVFILQYKLVPTGPSTVFFLCVGFGHQHCVMCAYYCSTYYNLKTVRVGGRGIAEWRTCATVTISARLWTCKLEI
jgi:hypothetical protein